MVNSIYLKGKYRKMNYIKDKVVRLNFIVCFVIPSFLYSQGNDTSKVYIKGYYISAGASAIQFYNNTYFDYLTTSSWINLSLSNSSDGTISIYGDSIPHSYNYTKTVITPSINLGVEFFSDAHKNFNHVIEGSFMQFSSKYSAASNFYYSGSSSSSYWGARVIDTIQN